MFHGNIDIIIVSVDQLCELFIFKYNFGYVIYFASGFPVSCFFLGFGYSVAITLVNRIAWNLPGASPS